MNTQITFTHLDRSDAVEVFVDEKITSILEKFGDELFTNCHVRLEKYNAHSQTRHKMFICDVVVQSRRYPTLHLRKESDDIHVAIQEVGTKLANTLSREHKNLISQRHQAKITEQPDTPAI